MQQHQVERAPPAVMVGTCRATKGKIDHRVRRPGSQSPRQSEQRRCFLVEAELGSKRALVQTGEPRRSCRPHDPVPMAPEVNGADHHRPFVSAQPSTHSSNTLRPSSYRCPVTIVARPGTTRRQSYLTAGSPAQDRGCTHAADVPHQPSEYFRARAAGRRRKLFRGSAPVGSAGEQIVRTCRDLSHAVPRAGQGRHLTRLRPVPDSSIGIVGAALGIDQCRTAACPTAAAGRPREGDGRHSLGRGPSCARL